MPPFRPANLNKRAYPGNASVIGPTCTTTVGVSTSLQCQLNADITKSCVCLGAAICLGCRYFGGCACPLVDECSCVATTTFNGCVPSGNWSLSEQYTAAINNAWVGISSTTTPPILFCTIQKGITCCSGSITDCKGYFISQGAFNGKPAATKWFVTPSTYECQQKWQATSGITTSWDTVRCSNINLGSCGWFVPDSSFLQNPGFNCRTYWDCWTIGGGSGNHTPGYASTSFAPPGYFLAVSFNDGVCYSNYVWNHPNSHGEMPTRSFYSC